MKTFFRYLFKPNFWCLLEYYNPVADEVVGTIINSNLKVIGIGTNTIKYENNITIWCGNYPFAYGQIIGIEGRPSRVSIERLKIFQDKKKIEYMTREAMGG